MPLIVRSQRVGLGKRVTIVVPATWNRLRAVVTQVGARQLVRADYKPNYR